MALKPWYKVVTPREYLRDGKPRCFPPATDEKRWVDGVLARKKGLGF